MLKNRVCKMGALITRHASKIMKNKLTLNFQVALEKKQKVEGYARLEYLAG